jgi:serine/threonine-protein kinase
MDPIRWRRIQSLFHAALAHAPDERHAFLRQATADDPSLTQDVLDLLAEDAREASVLDRDVAGLASDILGSDEAARVGHAVGRYVIVRTLGHGGMGIVYLARREDVGLDVAIKLLRDAWLSPDRRERFASEQRTLAQLRHPAIAQLHDADTLPDGTPWFAMEYVEGEPLTEWCASRRASLEERLRLFRQVCEAVLHAHRQAVIHRDLKPSNILVTGDGSVKLLDFGIAKQIETIEGLDDPVRTGFRLMTPAYAAPEQLDGGRLGTYTDVYALGVILYELITGRLPFDLAERSPVEAAAVILQAEPPRPSLAAQGGGPLPQLRRSAWSDLDVLCLTAMQKDPARRYQTVEALIRDVDHFLASQPLEARPDTLGYRTAKFFRRHARAVLATAAVFVAVIALTAFYTFRLARARNDAVAEAARTERIQRFMMNLFQGGQEQVGPADSLRVVTLVDRGVQEAGLLDAEPDVQAELYQTLGGIYQQLGSLDRADSLLTHALDRRVKLYGRGNIAVAGSLVALGKLRIDQARFDDAETLIREGLALDRRFLPPGHPSTLLALGALGKALEERGDYPQAIAVLDSAVHTRPSTASASNADLVANLAELANSHFYAGHLEASDSINRIVIGIYRQLYGERHPLVADAIINLGATEFERGHYAEAERYYRQALAITEAWYGPDHTATASALTMLARALNYENEHDSAKVLLRRALAIQERVYGPIHPAVASALNDLGVAALNQGDLASAKEDFSRMVQIYNAVYHGRHYLIGIAKSNLGSVYLKEAKYADAERLFREAIAMTDSTQGAEHVDAGIQWIKLGRAMLREGRYTEAVEASLRGYGIVSKQTAPSVSYLQAARADLAEAYDSLRQPEAAKKYREERDRIAADTVKH